MKKDVNFVLLLVIVVTMICFASFTSYYQVTLHNLTLSYNIKLKQLENTTKMLLEHKNKLMQTTAELQLKKERESELSRKYSSLREEKEMLEKEKARLESELDNTRNQLLQKTAELTQTQAQLVQTQDELTHARNQISALQNQISNLEEMIDMYREELEACQSQQTT